MPHSCIYAIKEASNFSEETQWLPRFSGLTSTKYLNVLGGLKRAVGISRLAFQYGLMDGCADVPIELTSQVFGLIMIK